MKPKNQLFKCLAVLFVLVASAVGAVAQLDNSPTQSVCIGNEPYTIDPSILPSPTYHWNISGGTAMDDWEINGTGTQITVDWKTEGVYLLSVFTRSNDCDGPTVQVTVTVNAIPTAVIAYTGSPWCTDAGLQTVSLTGSGNYTGGTYISTDGLTLNASTGEIDPQTSSPGTYVVTYTIPAAAGCAAVTATTSVKINALPTAAISYAGLPYCGNVTTIQAVTLTGTGAYTGGTYSSTEGLTLNPVTGEITPYTSTANTYTVTYTTLAADGCGTVTATIAVTISPIPVTSMIYHN